MIYKPNKINIYKKIKNKNRKLGWMTPKMITILARMYAM